MKIIRLNELQFKNYSNMHNMQNLCQTIEYSHIEENRTKEKGEHIMQEVEVRITSVCPPGGQGGIRAYASATIGGCFGVRGIKIVEGGRDGLFVSMPSRKTVDGYSEVCFPVTAEFREQLYGKVLGAYRQVMREVQTAAVQGYGSPPPGPGEEAGYVQMQ